MSARNDAAGASSCPYTVIDPPDNFPPPDGDGFYAWYRPEPAAKSQLVAVWEPAGDEPWHVEVRPICYGVGWGQPCPWEMDWLPGIWDASIFPLALTSTHVREWLWAVVCFCVPPGAEAETPRGNRGWKVLVRAARSLAEHFDARSTKMCGTPLPLTRESALAELEAHRDSIDAALRQLPDEQNPAPDARSVTTPAAARVATRAKKAKRSTERGEGRAKLIAALTKHHRYANGSCMNDTAIGNNELAAEAEVSGSTASAFFNDEFGGHAKYRSCCLKPGQLVGVLRILNNEITPRHILGDRCSEIPAPAEEREPEIDE